MQCLFCGKELALLKRLRGGSEFCSEAHRKEYQDQYEQLALARLMQAHQPPAEAPSLSPLPLGVPSGFSAPENLYEEVPAPAWQRPEVQHVQPSHPVAMIDAPASPQSSAWQQQPVEEPGPAPLAGFLNESVVPAVTIFQYAGLVESENALEHVAAPSLPPFANFQTSSVDSAPSRSQGSLPPAPRVELTLSLRALEHHTRTGERGLEVREFAGAAPIMDLHLRPNTGTEPAGSADVMEILMSPHPPQKAKSWLGVPRGFSAAPAELGDLARLDFTTTGFAYSDAAVSDSHPISEGRVQMTSPPPAPPQAEPQAEHPAEQRIEPAPARAELALPAEPAPPALVIKVLPVTLHGIAAPGGKSAPTFTSAITAAADVQIPTSAALPLRPMIVFGPAPEVAAAPVHSSPAQSKPVQAKPVQPTPAQPKPQERSRPSVAPAPKPAPIPRPVASAAPVSEPRPESRVEPRTDTRMNPRREAATSDAAIPWNMEASQSAWSKLSTGLKIGVAAAVIVAVSGIAYVVTRGNGKAANEAPAAATAAASVSAGVPISGGWIDDWANGSKSRRHISVLSGSAKLSDYRLEFQAQIETKAIGWIFRGLNPRNYYVSKLEIVTPGLEPTVALVHFAVVDGQDENRVSVPLPMKLRVDTTYKIRFDAVGNHFTTWVQDQKIDEWTDSRFGSGGVGFFSERDEHAVMQGAVNVVALVPKN
jgi:hypothetical protein